MKAITDTLSVSRSSQYEQIGKKSVVRKRHYQKLEDNGHLSIIRKIIEERPTYGYRRITAILNRYLLYLGQPRVNHKRIYRIMKINSLLLQRYTGRPARSHDGRVMVDRSDTRWCSDGFEIVCWNRERVRVVFSMDCCDREILSYAATTGGISGEMIKDIMAEAIAWRFGFINRLPEKIEWLSDNGSAYMAHETRSFAKMMGMETCTTPVQSPQSNGMAEAFIKTFKRDYVYVNKLNDAETVLNQLPKWFEDYNINHPHKALKMMSPREFRERQIKLDRCPVL
jgi:putative transposase